MPVPLCQLKYRDSQSFRHVRFAVVFSQLCTAPEHTLSHTHTHTSEINTASLDGNCYKSKENYTETGMKLRLSDMMGSNITETENGVRCFHSTIPHKMVLCFDSDNLVFYEEDNAEKRRYTEWFVIGYEYLRG